MEATKSEQEVREEDFIRNGTRGLPWNLEMWALSPPHPRRVLPGGVREGGVQGNPGRGRPSLFL